MRRLGRDGRPAASVSDTARRGPRFSPPPILAVQGGPTGFKTENKPHFLAKWDFTVVFTKEDHVCGAYTLPHPLLLLLAFAFALLLFCRRPLAAAALMP